MPARSRAHAAGTTKAGVSASGSADTRMSGPGALTTGAQGTGSRSADEAASTNQVLLVGRVAARPEERELPSGDLLVAVRIVVDRPPRILAPPLGVRSPTMDTIDCVAFAAGARRSALAWQPGDVVRLDGSLRRRFWRGRQGLASRYEVEIHRGKRLSRAA